MNEAMVMQVQFPEELVDRIADKVFDKVKAYLQIHDKRKDDTIMNVKALAKYLSVKEAWVREQARSGNIPSFKTGDQWKFRTSEIDKHFSSRLLLSRLSSSETHKRK